jgi:class 3 adenylate cyclase
MRRRTPPVPGEPSWAGFTSEGGRGCQTRRQNWRVSPSQLPRVSALAAPGQVLVSQTVKDLVAGSGIAFEDHGVQELKGVPGEWRMYAVTNP